MASVLSTGSMGRPEGMGARAEARMVVRSRLASVSLVLVLLAVSAFAVWSSRSTSVAASAVDVAQTLSGHYTRAQLAIASPQSADRL
ncbi:MAG: hypothetical protein QOE58_1641 [Actinomycetota bacterium]|nr:hypothetical protein [Actinomycetota bacterium]